MATIQAGAGAATAVGPAREDVPRLAEGVQLLGEMEQSGFKEPPFLARRADGQTIQLTDLLYQVLDAVDGRRDIAAIATELTRKVGKQASAEDVRFLVDEKLRPLGLLKQADGSEPQVEKANPLLALRFRLILSDEATTKQITRPFAKMFLPPVEVVVVVAFVAMVGWVLFAEGVGGGTREMLYRPGLLVLVFALAALSAGFHEFGHAAALQYGGGAPGAMGAGIYLVWPAFYTDVTDSYRLSRRDRLRTDLGGLYFNMVFALAVYGAWAATRFDALLVVIPLLLLQMVQQLLPLVRLDGYHILADLTGVPDLFARIRPTLASLRPGKGRDQRVTALKPWVRTVVTVWVVAVVPVLLVALVVAVITLPRLAATAWDSFELQRAAVSRALDDGDGLAVVAGALSVAALCLPVLGTAYQLGRLGGRSGRWAWARTDGRPAARIGAGTVVLALAATAAVLWWPNGEYRPLQAGERGRIQDAIAAVRHVPAGRPGLTPERAAALRGAPFRSATADAGTAGAETPGSTTVTTTVPSGTTDPAATTTPLPAPSPTGSTTETTAVAPSTEPSSSTSTPDTTTTTTSMAAETTSSTAPPPTTTTTEPVQP